MIVRQVELHDQVDVVHVDTTRRDVGSDQDPRVPGRKAVQGPLPLVLVAVAVNRGRVGARPGQLLSQPVRAVLGADEEQRPSRPAGDLRRDRHLVLGRQDQHPVLGGSGVPAPG